MSANESIIRIAAFDLLAEFIQANVPALSEVCGMQADPETRELDDSLGITPTRWKYNPNQAKQIASATYDTVVEEVGWHDVDVELKLRTETPYWRSVLEHRIVDLFLKQELSPGVISMPVPKCWNANIAWELGGEEWEPERVFDKQWYSTLTINGQIPALVTRGGVYTIDQLKLGLYEDPSSDLDTAVTVDTFDTKVDIERYEIEQDGTFTKLA